MAAGGGAGHVFDMIIRLRNNRNMRRRRPSYFKLPDVFSKVNYQTTKLRKATQEQMEAVRKKMRAQRKREILCNSLALIVSIGITAILCFLFMALAHQLFEIDVIFRHETASFPLPTR